MEADHNPKARNGEPLELNQVEYRNRLMTKLNCLIAVLEVACAKVRQTLAGPDPDVERLTRIHKNLKDTLQVCLRARKALDRCESMPDELPSTLGAIHASGARRDTSGSEIEMSSEDEVEKFAGLEPIQQNEIRNVDLDELCRRLLG